jgi:mRNA interferase YafQ
LAKSKPEEASPPPTLDAKPSSKFKKDVKRQGKSGKDLAKLRSIIEDLCAHRPLDPKHRDHPLGGDWKGWRDCHVEPDWVLIYKEDAGTLKLGRTESHAELGI